MIECDGLREYFIAFKPASRLLGLLRVDCAAAFVVPWPGNWCAEGPKAIQANKNKKDIQFSNNHVV